jgi:hypothetical protein
MEVAEAAADERTAWREERLVRVARTRVGREGRQRNISRRRSSPRAHMVVGAGGDFASGSHAMGTQGMSEGCLVSTKDRRKKQRAVSARKLTGQGQYGSAPSMLDVTYAVPL